MVVPVALYLAVNAGGAGADGWGVAMSTDTALALGLLALVGHDVPDRVRTFLLTVFVVDDLVALLVIAVVYTDDGPSPPTWSPRSLLSAWSCWRSAPAARSPRVRASGVAIWCGVLTSGVDPVVAGLAIGLTAAAYTPAARRPGGAPAGCSASSASSPHPTWPAPRRSG